MIRYRKTIIIALVLVFFVAVFTVVLVRKLHEVDTYKDDILRVAQRSLDRHIWYEEGRGVPGWHPKFSFSQVLIQERSSSEPFATADRLVVRLSLLPLLFNKIVIKDLRLEKPYLQFTRYADGTLNIQDLLEGEEGRVVQIHKLSGDKGTIIFTDHAFPGKEHVHKLDQADFFITNLGKGGKSKFQLSALLISQEGEGSLKIDGKVDFSREKDFREAARIDARLAGQKIHLSPYWDYYQAHVPFQKVSGQANLETTIKGSLKDFRAEGKIQVENLNLRYPEVFNSVLSPRNVLLDYSIALKPNEVTVKKVDFAVDQLRVTGGVSVKDISSRNPHIIAHGKSNVFKLEELFQYIPFDIIPQGVSEFIRNNIKGGVCRLDVWRLDGRLNEITQMEKGDNDRLLSLKATIIEGGMLQFTKNMPPFQKIRGELIIEGKDFILKNIAGEFGTSPFKLNGRVTGYYLGSPASYPATMTITPQLPELMWLMGEEAGKKFTYTGSSVLKVTGKGTLDQYQLDGEWDLGGVSYGYGDMIKKGEGRRNKITWTSHLNEKGITVSALNYDLTPLSLNFSGRYRWGENKDFRITAASNEFPLGFLRRHVPLLEKYQPAGRARMEMQAEGKNFAIADLRLGGRAILNNVSLVVDDHLEKITDLSGAIRLEDDTLRIARESRPLAFRIGVSPVFVFGELTGFKEGLNKFSVINLKVSSPELRLEDVGFTHDDNPDQKLTRLKTDISLKKGSLTIHSLSGYLGGSNINLKGHVSDFNKPDADLQITSSFLELEDLILLAGVRSTRGEKSRNEKEPQEKRQEKKQEMGTMKAAISVEKGTWQRIPFQDAQTQLVFDGQMVTFDPLELTALGGKVALKGSVDMMEENPEYRIAIKTENVSSRRLNRELGLRRILSTGPLTMDGGVVFRGKTVSDLEKTAEGDISFTVAGGTINGFSALSKILSILNVAQLLKMQLPDVMSEGMPYNEITGHFSAYNGILYTNDLVLKSDSMNMAIVGKIDMINNTLDLSIGVQPLQTIDRIVGIVPIIGWIIGGRDRTLIMVYFSVKGPINDPTVTAIPFQSMATGVFDIFKRIFMLPVEIFTNTGDVFLGR